MTRSLLDHLRSHWPPDRWAEVTVVLAVSGGPDSMALLRAMCEVRRPGPGRLVAAHYNHRLRGEESDADQAFVVDCCHRLDVPCETERAEQAAGRLAEEESRGQRYDFLTRCAARLGARYIATAHTADDQAETILHHIVRGTGLAGLSGMPRVRPLNSGMVLIRPLLSVRRAELLAYLEQIGQPYRDDASNQDPSYTRNRIRHELLPLLADGYNPNVVEALLRLGQLADDAQRAVSSLIEPLLAAVQIHSANSIVIDCQKLAGIDRHLLRELFVALWRRQGWPQQGMGFVEWDALAAHVQRDEPGSQTYAGTVQARRIADRLELTRR